MKIDEMRKLAVEKGMPENQAQTTKKADLKSFLDSFEQPPKSDVVITDNIPNKSSPKWTEYVLSLLTDKEKIEDRFPTCDGLRRVFDIVGGRVKSSVTRIVETADTSQNGNFGRATVEHTLIFYPHDTKEETIITEVADCYPGNTQEPYASYPSATASTVAEGRALRKALRLVRVLTADEVANASQEVKNACKEVESSVSYDDSITILQEKIIINKSAKIGSTAEKVISYVLKTNKDIKISDK